MIPSGNEMERMAISYFKARCLAVMERVKRTRRPLTVTRFGVPMAEVVPARPPERGATWLGCMRKTGRITGDIVSPAAANGAWEALNS
jgi:antitoxin (DNA-binding transcriptional repressor) of toxin-antitoxin stability system